MASDDVYSRSRKCPSSTTRKAVKTLECRVCEEVFSPIGDKVPRLLTCGHTLCHGCLNKLPLRNRTLLCPFDRSPTIIPNADVGGLKKNFALLELLEKLHQTSPSPNAKQEETVNNQTGATSPDSARVRALVDARTALVETQCKNQIREMQNQLERAQQDVLRLNREKQILTRLCNQKLNGVMENLQLCSVVTRSMQRQFESVRTANAFILHNLELATSFGSR